MRSGGKMIKYIALRSSMRIVARSRFGHIMGFFLHSLAETELCYMIFVRLL